MAGKRKGTEDERYLWGEMLRAIQEIKPTYVIAENVFGITNIDGGLVFEQVCLDLEAEGYEVQPFIIPAASKNAPHRRDRVWFVAQNPLFSRCLHGELEQEGTEVREFGNTCTRSSERIHLSEGDATNTDSNGLNECHSNNEINSSEGGQYAQRNIEQSIVDGYATDTDSDGQKWSKKIRNQRRDEKKKQKRIQFKRCKCDTWKKFPTQSPICGGDDGLPTELDGITFSKWRSESIKGYGNAIVPQVAYEIFKQL
jgi:DNA (cytosine-5)-methyltransferase 1